MGLLAVLGNLSVGYFLFVLIAVSFFALILTIWALFEEGTPAMYVARVLALLFALGSAIYWLQEWYEPSHNLHNV